MQWFFICVTTPCSFYYVDNESRIYPSCLYNLTVLCTLRTKQCTSPLSTSILLTRFHQELMQRQDDDVAGVITCFIAGLSWSSSSTRPGRTRPDLPLARSDSRPPNHHTLVILQPRLSLSVARACASNRQSCLAPRPKR